MKLLLLLGPQAVGKMTVGEEIAKETGMKLFHNHKTIDMVLEYFTWEESQVLIKDIRDLVFDEFLSVNKYDLIFTLMFGFNLKSEWDYFMQLMEKFKGHEVYVAELNASLEKRLERNVTENRLAKKWTKRDIEWSNQDLIGAMDKYRLESNPHEMDQFNFLKINTEEKSVQETAKQIIEHFKLRQ